MLMTPVTTTEHLNRADIAHPPCYDVTPRRGAVNHRPKTLPGPTIVYEPQDKALEISNKSTHPKATSVAESRKKKPKYSTSFRRNDPLVKESSRRRLKDCSYEVRVSKARYSHTNTLVSTNKGNENCFGNLRSGHAMDKAPSESMDDTWHYMANSTPYSVDDRRKSNGWVPDELNIPSGSYARRRSLSRGIGNDTSLQGNCFKDSRSGERRCEIRQFNDHRSDNRSLENREPIDRRLDIGRIDEERHDARGSDRHFDNERLYNRGFDDNRRYLDGDDNTAFNRNRGHSHGRGRGRGREHHHGCGRGRGRTHTEILL